MWAFIHAHIIGQHLVGSLHHALTVENSEKNIVKRSTGHHMVKLFVCSLWVNTVRHSYTYLGE